MNVTQCYRDNQWRSYQTVVVKVKPTLLLLLMLSLMYVVRCLCVVLVWPVGPVTSDAPATGCLLCLQCIVGNIPKQMLRFITGVSSETIRVHIIYLRQTVMLKVKFKLTINNNIRKKH